MEMQRPNRSDEHLPPEEEAKRAEETREYFQGIAPRRHSKPQRSEYSPHYTDDLPPSDQAPIPELHKLRDLEAHPEKLVCHGSEPVDEYVETEYYKDLNCIDKQHHTTGTGFIKVEKHGGDRLNVTSVVSYYSSCNGNPATNEWIPSSDTEIPISSKPNRSECDA